PPAWRPQHLAVGVRRRASRLGPCSGTVLRGPGDPGDSYSPGVMHATPRTGFTILVVDDDAVVRRVFVETLESAGYVVLAAGSAGEARRLTEAEEPALAVVDL